MDILTKKSFAVLCALVMILVVFNNVSAEDEYNTGEDMDVAIDQFGNEHQVWRELVNGTYQAFYGYQIIDTFFTTNSLSYRDQTVNNVIFDDGFLSIINCTINGNVIVTRGNVLLQDCYINGNVLFDMGRMTIINCDINGNLDIKNANIEIRYSWINGYLYTKQTSYDTFNP